LQGLYVLAGTGIPEQHVSPASSREPESARVELQQRAKGERENMKHRLTTRAMPFCGVVVAAIAVAGGAHGADQAAPVSSTPPTISGTPTVGQTLTGSDGTWSNSPTSFSYQWLRCNGGGNNCGSISGATTKTYTLAAADSGHAIRIRVTASNPDGSAAAQSDATAAVTPAVSTAAPKNTAAPTISGTTRVGQPLTAAVGTWSGNPTAFAFQWQHCDADAATTCTNIAAATTKTYVLHTADLGYRMRVKVTARNAKGAASTTSAATTVVIPAARLTNHRPTLVILSARFLGQTMYARFRICDDSYKNLTVIETDSRAGVASYTRRFTTLIAPKPCGVYTRHWIPLARFRGPGRYTLTLRARDKSGLTSLPARRSFSRG